MNGSESQRVSSRQALCSLSVRPAAVRISKACIATSCYRDIQIHMALDAATERLKAFADPSRVRLLALLSEEELTVAELTAITELPQPRVSTHLGRLKDAGLVLDRRDRGSSYYRLDGWGEGTKALWEAVRPEAADPLLARDRTRLG